jgi:quinohemoprotein ethanol dehydrogenase
MGPETHAVFNDIVLDGLYAPAGMASFKDVLSPRDAADIHAYLAKPLPGSQPEPKAKNAEFN